MMEMQRIKEQQRQIKEQQRQILDSIDELKHSFLTSGGRGNLSTDIAGELFRGQATASVVIIEYGDYQCDFCRAFEREAYPQIRDAYVVTGKIRFYFRDLPLPSHEHAMATARAGRCAADEGQFWKMHDELFAGDPHLTPRDIEQDAQEVGLSPAKFNPCFDSDRHTDQIVASISQAKDFGVRGTPSFLLGSLEAGGTKVKVVRILEGVQSFETFKSVVEPLIGTSPDARVSSTPSASMEANGGR